MTNVTCSAAAHAGNHHGDAVEGYGIEQMFEGTTERGVVDTDVIGVVDKVGYLAGIRVYGRVVVVHSADLLCPCCGVWSRGCPNTHVSRMESWSRGCVLVNRPVQIQSHGLFDNSCDIASPVRSVVVIDEAVIRVVLFLVPM